MQTSREAHIAPIELPIIGAAIITCLLLIVTSRLHNFNEATHSLSIRPQMVRRVEGIDNDGAERPVVAQLGQETLGRKIAAVANAAPDRPAAERYE